MTPRARASLYVLAALLAVGGAALLGWGVDRGLAVAILPGLALAIVGALVALGATDPPRRIP